MIQGLKMVPPRLEEGKSLGHYGVPGMKWGKRKAASAGNTAKSASESAVKMTKQQREIAVIALGTGAAVAAAIVAGPVGGMSVSALTSVARIKVQNAPVMNETTTENR